MEASRTVSEQDTTALVLQVVRSLLGDLHMATGAPGGPGRRGALDLDSDLVAGFGLDSLALVELQDRVERAFGVRLPDETLSTALTPRDWLQAAQRAQPAQPARRRATATPRTQQRRRRPARPAGLPWPEGASTLVEAAAWHAQAHPDQVSIRLLGGPTGGPGEEVVSSAALAAEATTMAHGLLVQGLDTGDRVALMLPTERAYFTVFLGILMAGGIPVPIYPPARRSAIEEHLRRQSQLLANAGATFLVTFPEAMAAARLLRVHVPTLQATPTPDTLAGAGHRPGTLPTPAPDDVALIQYTSGSTGDPKGVVLTHRQLLADIAAMGRAASVTTDDAFVSWLPLYHDMGLIGAWLAPMVFGFPLVAMSPLAFLARPVRWLEAISAFGGTISAAPNFAYQACVERVSDAELRSLDLSSWRVAFDGSEPVGQGVTERFIERFAAAGFRRGTMCPAYGLAEVGVGVSFTPIGQGPHYDTVDRAALVTEGRAEPVAAAGPGPAGAGPTTTIVSCGVPLPGYEVRVEGPSGEPLPERREGAVVCRGPSATVGYFANEAATNALWRQGWLHTGDLGYLADGQLYLTGRQTDLLIRAGRNLHPEEIETVLGGVPNVSPSGVAVFGVADPERGTDRLVAAVETTVGAPEDRAALQGLLRSTAVQALGVAPDEVTLIAPGTLPRTPSGKIRRAAARAAFEAGTLGRPTPPTAVQLAHLVWSGLGPAARRARRRTADLGYGVAAWALVLAVAAPLWVALRLPSSSRLRWRLTRAGGHSLRRILGIPWAVAGSLPPADRPAVVVANHPSFVDGLVLLLACQEPAVFATSTDLERQPLVGSFLRRLGCVFVDRSHPGRSTEAVDRLVAAVRGGGRLVIFPEGAIDPRRGIRPFHLGAFAVAVAAGCPVVPVGISGTRDVLRPGSFLPRRAPVRVTIGEPIAPTGDDFAAEVALRDAARQAVAELSGETPVTPAG